MRRLGRLILMVFLIAGTAIRDGLSAGPFISEFMAVNTRTLADEDGEFSDWIEIRSISDSALSLEGWYLTDESTNLAKWRFPAVQLSAGGSLVVFASDKDRRVAGSELHTNFKLTSAGEYLALVQPDGVTIGSEFAPAFPAQLADVSYGVTASAGSQTTLVPAGTTVRVLVPSEPPPADWTRPDFAGANTWQLGQTGVGFEVAGNPTSARVLFVVNTNAAVAGRLGDQSVVNRLTGVFGFQVTVVHDTASETSQTNDQDLVLVSSTVASGNINTKFRDVALPVIQWEGALTDDFLLSGSGANLAAQTAIDITAAGAAHPIGAGLAAGSHVVRGAATTFHLASSAAIASGGVIVATGASGAPAILAVDKGALLNNGSPAAGRRVHLFIGDEAVNGMNSTGLALFDATVNWALGSAVAPKNYTGLIATDLETTMHGVNSSALLRLPFSPAEIGGLGSLVLRVKYDDGFVAWLNGTEVARRNAPALLSWNSTAETERATGESLAFEEIDLTPHLGSLVAGTNMLAFQVLNVARDDSDLLLLPELVAESGATLLAEYYVAPTPGAVNQSGTLGIVPPVGFSVERGFFFEPFTVALTNSLAGAEIRFTTNGTPPTATSGEVYSQPISIPGTTVLRAAAFRPGYHSTNRVTMTYLFPEQVVKQPLNVPGWPRPTQSAGQGTRQHDYEMDPDVVNAAAYSNDVRAAMLAIPTLSIAVHQPDMWDAAGNGGFYRLFDVEKPVSVELIYPGAPEKNVLGHGGLQGHSHDRIKRSLRLSFSAAFGDSKFNSTLFRDGPLSTGKEPKKVDNIILRAGNNRAWSRSWNPDRTTYTEDEWYRATQQAMSGVGTAGHFVHLYINGLYWGLYNPVQRPDTDFAASYFGGEKEDYFAVSHSGEHGGTPTRWNYLKGALAAKNMSVAANYDELREYLAVTEFIDYLLVTWHIGMTDWPQNNWWGGNRNNPPGPFKFYAWDGEWSWGVGASSVRARVHPDFNANGGNTSRDIPRIWHSARVNPDFMMLVADRAFKHTSPSGALGDASSLARWQVLSNAMWIPIVAESARWGDTMTDTAPRTRDVDWLNEINRIRFLMTGNGALLLFSLRAQGYYPTTTPPEFNAVSSETVPAGFQIELSHANSTGTIYFTLDGSDPRQPGGVLNPQATAYTAPVPVPYSLVAKARVLNGATWSALNEVLIVSSNAPSVRITEIMYHPAPVSAQEITAGLTNNNDFEYIELQNVGSTSLDLDGARFTQGISFTFSNIVVAPGGSVLLVKRQTAFTSRYGTAPNIIGEFGGSLDNSGERIKLVDAVDLTILDFTYNDAWHPLTDAHGHSLVIIDPLADTSRWNKAEAWRSSTQAGGSPGVIDPAPPVQSFAAWVLDNFSSTERADITISGPDANPDGDLWNNFKEYSFVLNPKGIDASGAPIAALLSDTFSLTFTRLNFATDVLYQLEAADEVTGPWRLGSAELTQEVIATTPLTHTVRVRLNQPASQAPRQFLRYSAQPVSP